MDEATRLFSKVFFALIGTWSDTRSFRRIVTGSIEEAQRQLLEQSAGWLDEFIHDPTNAPVFLDREKFLEDVGGVQGAAEQLTEREIKAVVGSIDAASLVFMHSGLDAAVHDLCRVTALVDPDQWQQFVEDQQERLGVLRSRGYDAVARERIATHVESLSHESLIKKTDRLFQVCRPDRSYSRKGYTFDRDRLVALDDLRHAIVHRERVRAPIPDISEAIDFMHQTGLFLFGMVNHRYGVKVDPAYLK